MALILKKLNIDSYSKERRYFSPTKEKSESELI